MFHRYQTRLSGPAAGGVVKNPLSAKYIPFVKSPLVKVCCHFKQRCYFGSSVSAMSFILVDSVPDDRPSLPITCKPCRPLADSALYDISSCKGIHRSGRPIIRERLSGLRISSASFLHQQPVSRKHRVLFVPFAVIARPCSIHVVCTCAFRTASA